MSLYRYTFFLIFFRPALAPKVASQNKPLAQMESKPPCLRAWLASIDDDLCRSFAAAFEELGYNLNLLSQAEEADLEEDLREMGMKKMQVRVVLRSHAKLKQEPRAQTPPVTEPSAPQAVSHDSPGTFSHDSPGAASHDSPGAGLPAFIADALTFQLLGRAP